VPGHATSPSRRCVLRYSGSNANSTRRYPPNVTVSPLDYTRCK
jgi:hypothetical protein